jgi:DNA-binding MarR family transcriptional regulator
MSWDKLHAEIRRRRDLSLSAKLVFGFLDSLVPTGVHPSRQTIADECGVSEKTARKAVIDLERAGLIRVQPGAPGERSRFAIVWTPGGSSR